MSSSNNFAVLSNLLVTLSNIVDQNGNPAIFPAPPVYSTSNSAILTLSPAADGLSATGVVQQTGSVVITVVGGGVTETVSIDVTAGAVVSFQINVTLAPVAPVAPAGA